MARKLISSGSALEKSAGYSRAVVDGGFVFVAGCTGLDYSNDSLAEGAEEQTRQTFRNIEWALAEAGCTLKDVVRSTLYVCDRADVPEILKVCGEKFGDIRPATTMVEVQGLVHPDMVVEVEAEAVVS